MKKLLTIEEASQILNLSVKRIYHMKQQGTIPSIKIGASLRFNQDELEKWVNEQSIPAKK